MTSTSPHKKPYYAFLHSRDKNVTKDTFYEPASFSWAPVITDQYALILREITSYLDKDTKALKPYFAGKMVNAPRVWKTFSFYFWGKRMSAKACRECPGTVNLLRDIPGLVSASVSIMEPHAEIKPHFGDTDAIYRCHLGLVIPGGLPGCGIRVGYEDRAWQHGQLIVFNDANYHTAWNQTDQRRIVMILDIIRPEYLRQQKWICSLVLASIFRQLLSELTGIFKGKDNFFTKGFIYFNAALLRVFAHSLKRKSASL